MRYLIVLAVLFNSLTLAEELDKVTLQLQWYHQFQFAGYYVAKERGFYKEAGLDVEIKEVDLGRNLVDDVIDERVEFGIGGSSLIADRANGKQIVALAAILQSSPIVLVTKESSGINTIEDLKGKRFGGHGGGTIGTASIHAMLQNKEIDINHVGCDHNKTDVENLLADNVDVISIYKTSDLYSLKQMGVAYRVFNPKDHGFSFYSDILFTNEEEVHYHKERTLRFKNASLKGWEYAFSHIDETVNLILDKYNTQHKTYDALTFEAIGLKELAYYRTNEIGTMDKKKIKRIYEIYKKIGLLENNNSLGRFILQDDAYPVMFTEEEEGYLKYKEKITICGKTDWKPYIDFTGDVPKGIAPEIVKEYEKIIGIPIEYVKTDSWDDCINKTSNREIDVADVILQNPNIHEHLTPSLSFESDSLILASKLERPYISDVASAGHLNVAIIKGNDNLGFYVKTNYPNLVLHYVRSTDEGLQKVLEGEVDAYVGMFRPTAFAITEKYANELKINGQFNTLQLKGSFGVRKDDPILLGILNKAIESLDPKIKREIINSWISVKQEKAFDYSLFWKILLAIVFFVLILIYRQRILKRENRKLEHAYRRIAQQQQKLQEQRTLYELVFKSTTDGELLLKNGKFIDCNAATVKMLNFKNKEEVLRLTPAILSPAYQPDGRLSSEKADEMIALAYENGMHRFEWVHTKATGETFWAEATLTPIAIDDTKLLHVVWRDISERKKLEHDNASLKEQIELAFSASRDGIWDWDMQNNTYYFSPRWKEMLGYSDDELDNNLTTWRSLMHPDDIEQANNEIKRNLEGQTNVYENKHRLRHKDGHWVWILDRGLTQFNENGQAIRMIGTHTDLSTEINLTNKLSELNHSLEARIDEAVRSLKKAQEQAKLGSWKLNIETNELLWSDEIYNIFELPNTSEVTTYENFLGAIHPDDVESVNSAFTNSLKTQVPYEITHRLLMADGRIKYVKEHCDTSFDADGKPLVSVGTIQDITTEYTAVQSLRRKDEMLFRQSRLAQMGEMISMIAHQWRQPLSAISMTSAALERKVEQDQYDKTFFDSRLNRISEYVQHLSSTIEDFRNFFKSDKDKQETRFSDIIDNALNLVGQGFESRNITLLTEYKCQGKMFTYSNELLQVVLNLLKNAEDALLERKIENPVIQIRCYSDEKRACLEIEDNAGGIEPEILEKIFEPYFTTKDEHNGTGLGLYMSKVIVEEHCEGKLRVSNSGQGAMFTIEMDKKSQ